MKHGDYFEFNKTTETIQSEAGKALYEKLETGYRFLDPQDERNNYTKDQIFDAKAVDYMDHYEVGAMDADAASEMTEQELHEVRAQAFSETKEFLARDIIGQAIRDNNSAAFDLAANKIHDIKDVEFATSDGRAFDNIVQFATFCEAQAGLTQVGRSHLRDFDAETGYDVMSSVMRVAGEAYGKDQAQQMRNDAFKELGLVPLRVDHNKTLEDDKSVQMDVSAAELSEYRLTFTNQDGQGYKVHHDEKFEAFLDDVVSHYGLKGIDRGELVERLDEAKVFEDANAHVRTFMGERKQLEALEVIEKGVSFAEPKTREGEALLEELKGVYQGAEGQSPDEIKSKISDALEGKSKTALTDIAGPVVVQNMHEALDVVAEKIDLSEVKFKPREGFQEAGLTSFAASAENLRRMPHDHLLSDFSRAGAKTDFDMIEKAASIEGLDSEALKATIIRSASNDVMDRYMASGKFEMSSEDVEKRIENEMYSDATEFDPARAESMRNQLQADQLASSVGQGEVKATLSREGQSNDLVADLVKQAGDTNQIDADLKAFEADAIKRGIPQENIDSFKGMVREGAALMHGVHQASQQQTDPSERLKAIEASLVAKGIPQEALNEFKEKVLGNQNGQQAAQGKPVFTKEDSAAFVDAVEKAPSERKVEVSSTGRITSSRFSRPPTRSAEPERKPVEESRSRGMSR